MTIRKEYSEFLRAFDQLNAYEIDHFGDRLFAEMKAVLAIKKTTEFCEQDIKEALVHAMRLINLEIAGRGIEDAKLNLMLAQSATLSDQK